MRIKELKNSVILKDSDEIQFLNYIKIGNFLNKKMLSAPKIYFYDLENKIAIIEDLGEKSIFKIYKKETFNLYKRIIDFLIELQFKAKEGFLNLSLKRKKIFDYESLRWETDYFKREFLINFLKFKEEELKEMDKDFDKLAKECNKMPKLFMHRDFQSTNIFLKQNKIRITDFQTAHIGPFTYDLSSLLEDPYVEINETVKEKLLFYYYDRIKDRFRKMSFDEFYHYYLLTSSQRLMQALAAYSFLSIKKNKKWFKKFIKPAMERLKKLGNRILKRNFMNLIIRISNL